MPQTTFVPGAARNIARLSAITSAKINDQPNIRALLKVATSVSEKLFTRIQALPNNSGEYQSPPRMKVESAATKTATKLILEKSIGVLLWKEVIGNVKLLNKGRREC